MGLVGGAIQFIAMLAWGAIGLLFAVLGLALLGWRVFWGTLLVMWIGVPTVFVIYDHFSERAHQRQIAEVRLEYEQLCSSELEFAGRNATDVTEVAIWPPHGPSDSLGNDYLYGLRGSGPISWTVGRENGRYGGYRSAVVLTPDAPAEEGPRYRVRLKHLTAGVHADGPRIRGTQVEIFDSHTQELIARRTDFRFRGESCFKVPASKPHEERVDENLAFIHRVLVPKPGVEIIHKDLPTIHERSTVRPDAIQQVVAAKVVKTWADLRTHLQSIDRALPEGVAYGAVTIESWDDQGTDRFTGRIASSCSSSRLETSSWRKA